MNETSTASPPLFELLAASSRPIYAIDAERRIVYCNAALEKWLELPKERVVGRLVEYHSESDDTGGPNREAAGPLSGLCPPPRALAGEVCAGTASSLLRDGRLVHRRADFMPLDVGEFLRNSQSCAVVAILAAADLSPQELTTELSDDPTSDDLHRYIRRFRRNQAARYSIESLLGASSAMRKVRLQVAAAAASSANALICGPAGAGRAHIARAIHYQAVGDATAKFLPLDGHALTDEMLRRTIDSLAGAAGDSSRRSTLLVENVECLSPAHQSQLIEAMRRGRLTARIIATTYEPPTERARPDDSGDTTAVALNPALRDAASTITIHLPRLADRPEDLPLLAQYFLEAANRGSLNQIGSIHPQALDLLALYSWPGELDELRDVVTAAHRAATSHIVGPADLPAVLHHAAKAAALPHRAREPIVLNELLTAIEREAIRRALEQSGGNKSEAADLLGLTRPRLYRRMEQLGLAPPPSTKARADNGSSQLPDFREIDPEQFEP